MSLIISTICPIFCEYSPSWSMRAPTSATEAWIPPSLGHRGHRLSALLRLSPIEVGGLRHLLRRLGHLSDGVDYSSRAAVECSARRA